MITRWLTLLLIALAVVPANGQAPGGANAGQKVFPDPDDAAQALLQACKDNDTEGLVRIFGERYREFSAGIDDAEERAHRRHFYERSKELTKLDERGDDQVVIVVGRDLWPFPVPLVRVEGGWRFDTAVGEEEIRARRIGQNELVAMEVCREYVRAQVEYAAADRDGDEVLEYAQRLGSSPGRRDGLYWAVDEDSGEQLSPFGPLIARADGYFEHHRPGDPFMGYYFKVLKRQGPNPPGGEYDYVINGNMIAGFALLAYPEDYGASGVMTCAVSHQGKVFERDLGAKTCEIAGAMADYDPDQTWTLVVDD